MKKFLTVLLVIAVMFTFSFGSAFAATPVLAGAEARLVEQAADYAKANLAEIYAKAYAVILAKTAAEATNEYITEAAWAAATADAVDAMEDDVDLFASAYINNGVSDDTWNDYPSDVAYTAKKLFGAFTDYIAMAELLDADENEVAVMAAKKQFDIDVEKSMAKYDKVEWELYSKTTGPDGSDDSYYDLAVAAAKASKAHIKGIFYAANGDYTYGRTAVSAFKGDAEWVEAKIANGDATGIAKLTKQYWDEAKTLEKGTYAISDITTVKEEAATDTLAAAKTAQLKAQIAQNVATYLTDANATAKGEYTKAEWAEIYTEIYGYVAEELPYELETEGCLQYALNQFNATTVENFETTINTIKNLEAVAAKYAAEKDENGVLVRDAEDIADIVEEAKLYEYAKVCGIEVTPATSAAKAAEVIKAMSVDLDEEYLEFQKASAKDILADGLEDVLVDYYDLEDEAVKAAYEVAYAAIDAAKDEDEIQDALDDLEDALDVKLIPNKQAVKDLFVNKAAMANELSRQETALANYVAFMNSNIGSYKLNHVTDGGENVVRDYYIAQGARTAAEMKALTGVVEAVAATLPTVGDIEAAKKAAEDAVKALPAASKVVSADKAAIVAAFELTEAYEDICELAGEDTTKTAKMDMSAQIAALRTALVYDVNLAFVKADKADKAAMRSLKSEIWALNDELVNEVELDGFAAISNEDVVKALKKIQETELAAVEKAINAIPINVTFGDEAVVKAARAAYDAYVADWANTFRTDMTGTYNYNGKDYMDGFAKADADNYRDLALAEAVLGLNAEDEAYSVEALKITASSKATKGAITVKWTVKGDTSAVEGYEIWKSTKKNSGYKKAFTATKMSYKNTKGLKKGTRYYYKVRAIAYTAEGEKVKSDWSNKAYRVAK